MVENADQRVRHVNHAWVADGARTLDVPGIALADYSFTSLGNLQRADRAIDWVQQRSRDLDESLADTVGRENMPGTPAVHATIDAAQGGFWKLYRFAQRAAIQLLDEMLLGTIENQTDRAINAFRTQPAEIIVEEPVEPNRVMLD